MKKLAKLAALLAAAALLFGAVGCSGGDDDDPKSEPTLKSISVAADGDVKDHYNGDETEFDHTGLTVTAHYSDETTKDVTGDATFTATYKDEDGAEKLFPVAEKNIYKVTVTAHYEGMEDTLDTPITITVGDVVLESISVSGSLTKKSYKQGADLDYTGITVKAHYDIGEPVSLSHPQVRFEATYNDGKEFTTSLEPNDYSVTITAHYEGKEASLDEPVTITIEEADDDDDDDGEETYFKSFLASELSGDITREISDDDKTWVITPKSGKTLQKKLDVNVTTYGGKTYTARLAANNSQGEGIIKLKIGAGQTKILRVDAGTSQGSITAANPDKLEDGTIKVGGTTWAVHLAASTKYFEVTGGDDGYVAIDLTGEKANIYAITVVDEAVDTSTIERTAVKVTYNPPVITFAEPAEVGKELKATVADPIKTTTTYTAKVDGVAAPTLEAEDETLSDITFKYSWSKGDNEIPNETTSTYTPEKGGVYTVTVSYTAEDGKPYSASKSVTVKSNITHTVTFEAGEGSFASGEETTFTVHEGLTLKEEYPDFKEPKPTAQEGKVFTGWESSVEGITTESPVTDNVIFTAQYGDKPGQWYGTLTVTTSGTTKADDGTDLTENFADAKKITVTGDGTSQTFNISAAGNSSRRIVDNGLQLNGDNDTVSFETSEKSKIVIKIRSGNDTRKWKVTGPNNFDTGELARKDVKNGEDFKTEYASNYQTITIPNAGAGEWKIIKVGKDEVHLDSIQIATASN